VRPLEAPQPSEQRFKYGASDLYPWSATSMLAGEPRA